MVKGKKFIKMVMITVVDGKIKGAHEANWKDIEHEIEKCDGVELEELREAVDAECARRSILRCKREVEEEIAFDAMYD